MHHLSQYAAAGREASLELVARAVKQLALIGFDMFKDQVVPFLSPDLAVHYGTPDAWKAMSNKVRNDLSAGDGFEGAPVERSPNLAAPYPDSAHSCGSGARPALPASNTPARWIDSVDLMAKGPK